MQLLFIFLPVTAQKPILICDFICMWLYTLSFSVFKSENNLQYNFHIIHVLKLFVYNVYIIQENK
jgi:hypothetical protein